MALSESATELAMRSLVDTETLRGGQEQNSLLEKVRSHLLHREMSIDLEEKLDTKSNMLDDRDPMWYTPVGNGKLILAIHRSLVSDLIALFHAMYGYDGVASTLAPLRVRFQY